MSEARERPEVPVRPSDEAGGSMDAPADRDGFRGGGGESEDVRNHEGERGADNSRNDSGTDGGGQEREAAPVSARGHDGSGMSALLSSFLPPKPGGLGVLGDIGLEELLLLGLFLLLSQSDSEDDTLMLLALLFLYR